MGKKSLIKSTTKKKAETKKDEEKTTKKATAKTKKAPAKAAKKTAAPKTRTTRTSKSDKPKTKPASKKPSKKELIFLKFEAMQAVDKKISAPAPTVSEATAPPLITATDPGEVARLQSLIARKFSMAEVKASAKAPESKPVEAQMPARKPAEPEAAPEPKPAPRKLSRKELLFLKFDALQSVAQKLPAPKPALSHPTAPALITATDPEEVKRLRSLMARKFSMAEVKMSAKAPESKPVDAQMPTPKPEAPKTEPVAAAVETAPPKPAEPEPAPEPQKKPTTPDVKDDVAQKITASPKPPAKPVPAPVKEENAAYITFENPKEKKTQTDPVSRSIKLAAAAAAFLILVLLAASANNSSKYYIDPTNSGIEIWKGDFSPKDKSLFMVLPGVGMPETVKDVYSKEEVFPLIFNYYIGKSDALLNTEGLPDFEGIRRYLNDAEKFAVTNEMQTAVSDRLNAIERMTLLYKADVALEKNTMDSLESAIMLLKEAGKLKNSEIQAEEIEQKLAAARDAIAVLKNKSAIQQPADEGQTPAPAQDGENSESHE